MIYILTIMVLCLLFIFFSNLAVGGHTGTVGVRATSNGTDQMKERERDECYITNALETVVLIVVRSVNIPQDDHCHFLDLHISTCLTAGRTHSHQVITLR